MSSSSKRTISRNMPLSGHLPSSRLQCRREGRVLNKEIIGTWFRLNVRKVILMARLPENGGKLIEPPFVQAGAESRPLVGNTLEDMILKASPILKFWPLIFKYYSIETYTLCFHLFVLKKWLCVLFLSFKLLSEKWNALQQLMEESYSDL